MTRKKPKRQTSPVFIYRTIGIKDIFSGQVVSNTERNEHRQILLVANPNKNLPARYRLLNLVTVTINSFDFTSYELVKLLNKHNFKINTRRQQSNG